MEQQSLPTPDLLRQLLHYDPETGLLTWKPRPVGTSSARTLVKHWNSHHAGKVAGTPHRDGTIAVKILNRILLAHRVIWAMVHNDWPECVYHRNGKTADNRLVNLRATTRDELAEQLAAERKQAMQAA